MDERRPNVEPGLWISVADFLHMVRVMERQQAVIESLLPDVSADEANDGSLCFACQKAPRDGYKYCVTCKPIMQRKLSTVAKENRRRRAARRRAVAA
jgi:hypothetical protein